MSSAALAMRCFPLHSSLVARGIDLVRGVVGLRGGFGRSPCEDRRNFVRLLAREQKVTLALYPTLLRRGLGRWPLAVFLVLAGFLASCPAYAQQINRLIVEVRTQDKLFAGTDDDVHLQIGGRDFSLDDPNRDDFERGNTDHFEFDLSNQPLSIELIRGIGQISVTKIQDSFFGGGWAFGGLTIWADNATLTDPLYSNSSTNDWLDGDHLEWTTTLGDPGWNVPEPPPFPPCSTGIILLKPNAAHKANAADPTTTDSDCDGIPDASDPTFDQPADSDGDGLPDLYETQTGSNPQDSDSDHDGWADGRNRRSYLVLTHVHCIDEQEDIGSDELYLAAEDVRYPASFDLDGYWAMNDGTQRSPGVIIDVRALPATAPPASYRTRLRLRESDFTILERPTDDTFDTFELEWNEDGTATHTYESDDAHYVLTFRWFTLNFRDPYPTQNVDGDHDGFNEDVEARLSIQDPTVQPQDSDGNLIRKPGYDGLADPERRELWVEIDASGSDQTFLFDAKQMVASQFAYHGVTPRFDDGFLGGGQILDYVETWTPADLGANRNNDTRFSPHRRSLGHFRYALLVDVLKGGEGFFGHGSFNCPPCDLIFRGVPVLGQTLIAQAQPIFFMHELGHTLGLCHRAGDKGKTCSTCPIPAGFVGCTQYCGVDRDSTTAMGSEQDGSRLGQIVGAVGVGVGAGIVAGGLIGTAIGGLPGAIVGGIAGAVVGIVVSIAGLSYADFYERDVNYHDNEWGAINL